MLGFGQRDAMWGEPPVKALLASFDEQAFDAVDELEKGFADEGFVAKALRHPEASSARLTRCSIVHQEGSDEYHLLSETLDLLMVARHLPQEDLIEFLCPGEAPGSPTPGARGERRRQRPAFSMSLGEGGGAEMTLVQGRCECCAHRPRHLTCEYMGKGQQVARIRHSRRSIGGGKARVHRLEVHIPPVVNGTKSAVWCPVFTGKDLGCLSPSASSRSSSTSMSPSRRRTPSKALLPECLPGDLDEPLSLTSRLPEWDAHVESLVLDFQGRSNLCVSPRNFMLEYGSGRDAEIVFQHAQNGRSTWCLDYKHPLSTVQAFAIAMASLHWD